MHQRIHTAKVKIKKMIQGVYRDLDIPTISFSGKWLLDAGFIYGDTCIIEASENRLIITTERHIQDMRSQLTIQGRLEVD